MAFKKGQSGNPGGRPKGVAYVRDKAQEHADDAIDVLVSLMGDAQQPGSVRRAAASDLLDRGFGKPPQTITDDRENALVRRVDAWLDNLSDADYRALRAIAKRTSNGAGISGPH